MKKPRAKDPKKNRSHEDYTLREASKALEACESLHRTREKRLAEASKVGIEAVERLVANEVAAHRTLRAGTKL